MSSYYGNLIHLSIFGQSHSAGIGAVADGLPTGFKVDMDALRAFMARRAPGQSNLSTARKEADEVEFLSGLAEGYTCGAPLSVLIRNTNERPGDYSPFQDTPRPGHADYVAHEKYGGYEDASGGGHFSGRLTAPLCAVGGIAMQILEQEGISVAAHALEIAGVRDASFHPVDVCKADFDSRTLFPVPVLNPEAGKAMEQAVLAAKADGDSVGGIIECAAIGLPVGMGDPMFLGMENRISSAVFAVPAVRGIEFGAGFAAAAMRGSAHNDSYRMKGNKVVTATNYHGGILGGITSGMPLIFRVAIKPTPSIALEQQSVSLSGGVDAPLAIKGRHDPCIVPRAVPCIEAAAAIALLDAYLAYKSYR